MSAVIPTPYPKNAATVRLKHPRYFSFHSNIVVFVENIEPIPDGVAFVSCSALGKFGYNNEKETELDGLWMQSDRTICSVGRLVGENLR